MDASVAKAIISRRGTSNKIKHVHLCFLWIQRLQRKEFSLHKCGTKDNPADLGTKNLDQSTIEDLCNFCSIYLNRLRVHWHCRRNRGKSRPLNMTFPLEGFDGSPRGRVLRWQILKHSIRQHDGSHAVRQMVDEFQMRYETATVNMQMVFIGSRLEVGLLIVITFDKPIFRSFSNPKAAYSLKSVCFSGMVLKFFGFFKDFTFSSPKSSKHLRNFKEI